MQSQKSQRKALQQEIKQKKWVTENLYTFSIAGQIVNEYKFSGTHFINQDHQAKCKQCDKVGSLAERVKCVLCGFLVHKHCDNLFEKRYVGNALLCESFELFNDRMNYLDSQNLFCQLLKFWFNIQGVHL